MEDTNLKNKTLSSLIWKFAERCGAQGVTFLVSIVLARLLGPDEYGTVALIMVVITILQVFVDSGLGNALIQKKNSDDLDFSSVFYFNIFICIVLYIGLFITAPWIADFFAKPNTPDLTPYLRALGLMVVVSGVKNVQQAYVSKHLLFKKFFYSTIGGTIGAAIVGILLAYLDFGAWAIVAQQLFNVLVGTIILWITVKWRPKKLFSFQRLKELLSFGWKLLASSLIDTIYNNIQQLVIGKEYTEKDLGFFNQGKQFPFVIVTNINASIDSVLLPVMAKEQDHIETVKLMTQRAIKISTYIMAPMMIGLICVADSLVPLILTEKWTGCIPYLQLFCLNYMVYPIHTANLNAIKAMGRSDLFLRMEIAKKTIGFIVLLVSMRFGVLAIAYGLLLTTITSSFINALPNKNLLYYSYFEQIKDILPAIGLALIMGIIVYPLGNFFSPLVALIVQVGVGAIIYIGLSYMTKNESFFYLLNLAKAFLKKR